jgi:hypothetical protein
MLVGEAEAVNESCFCHRTNEILDPQAPRDGKFVTLSFPAKRGNRFFFVKHRYISKDRHSESNASL